MVNLDNSDSGVGLSRLVVELVKVVDSCGVRGCRTV